MAAAADAWTDGVADAPLFLPPTFGALDAPLPRPLPLTETLAPSGRKNGIGSSPVGSDMGAGESVADDAPGGMGGAEPRMVGYAAAACFWARRESAWESGTGVGTMSDRFEQDRRKQSERERDHKSIVTMSSVDCRGLSYRVDSRNRTTGPDAGLTRIQTVRKRSIPSRKNSSGLILTVAATTSRNSTQNEGACE